MEFSWVYLARISWNLWTARRFFAHRDHLFTKVRAHGLWLSTHLSLFSSALRRYFFTLHSNLMGYV